MAETRNDALTSLIEHLIRRRNIGYLAGRPAIPAPALVLQLDAGEIWTPTHDREPGVLLVHHGWLAHQKLEREGMEQIFDLMLPSDASFLPMNPEPARARADRAAHRHVRAFAPTLAAIYRLEQIFEALRDFTSLRIAFGSVLADEPVRLLRQLERLNQRRASHRVATFLLETYYRLNAVGLADSDRFRMPLTQTAIAAITGLTHVHVNRTMRAYVDMGLLRYAGSRYDFPDRRELERYSGFDNRNWTTSVDS